MLIAFSAVLAFSGCSDRSTTQTCEDCGPFGDFLGALCDYIDRCPDAMYPIAYRNRDECIAILNFVLTCRLRDYEVNDEHNYTVERIDPNYDPVLGRACIDWIGSASCDLITQGLECGSDEECEGVDPSPCADLFSFMGEDDDDDYGVGLGESCEEDSCRGDLVCAEREFLPEQGAYSCRLCKAPLAEGEECAARQLPCGDDLVCRGDVDETYRCLPLLADGETCSASDHCLSEFCNYNTMTCDPGGNEGDPCLQPGDCRMGYCDASSGLCTAFRESGETCTDDAQCANGNCHDETGVCGLPDGEACSSYSDYECASGYCDDATSTCAPRKPNGESCESDTECQSGYCDYWGGQRCSEHCYTDEECLEGQYCSWDTETCLDKKPDGSTCDDDEECLSGLCDYMTDSCGPKPGIGDPCSSSYACYPEGYCSGGVCTARKGPDQACDSLDACLEPFFCMEGRCRIMNLACEPGEPGEMCAFFMVCEEGSYCDMAGGIVCRARKGAGESCAMDNECLESLMCVYDEVEGMLCTERKAAGEECTASSECAEGLYCIYRDGATLCGAGPEGMPCDEYDAPCPEGYFCDHTCQVLRGPGEDCSYWELCEPGLWCDTIDGCMPPHGLGEECRSDEPCADGLYCDSDSVCQTRVGLGQECSPYYPIVECMEDLYCDRDSSPYTCAPKLGTGEDCDDNEECLGGVCDYSYGCMSTDQCVMP